MVGGTEMGVGRNGGEEGAVLGQYAEYTPMIGVNLAIICFQTRVTGIWY